MAAAVQLERVSAGRDLRIEKILSIGAVYNLPAATPAFSYRGIAGVPPPTDPNTIQQRTRLAEAVYTKLTQPGINALALTGMGGMGKSTLAALLYQYVQAQPLVGNDFFQAPPLWLSIDRAATFADVIGTIFQQLDKPLTVLDHLSPAGQAEALFKQLDTLALPRLIVLDQFDNLLDPTTGKAKVLSTPSDVGRPTEEDLSRQPGVGELIDALNSRPWKSSCRLLLTSRPYPKGTRETLATCLHDYAVDGLTQQEGLALFHSRGIQAPEAQLQTAVTFCDGHPQSLVLLMALIQLYGLPLADLLAEPTLWIGDIATNLLDAVFRRLTEEQRTLLRALSVYRTAVPVAALTPFLTGSTPQQVLPSLRSLLVQQVIQPAGAGRYQEHAVVAKYLQAHFVEDDQQANQQALRAAHAIAAYYYLQQTLPLEQQRGVNDVQEIIEAVWHYTQAAQWQEAYALIEQENLLYNLLVWGGYLRLVDLCQWFLSQTEWQPEPHQTFEIYLYLGRAYITSGKKQQALESYEQALSVSRGQKILRQGEGIVLSGLGDVYSRLGDQPKALEYYEQALSIFRAVGDYGSEGIVLGGLGDVYSRLGDQPKALEYYEQALSIFRAVGDHRSEGVALGNLGDIYRDLSPKSEALEYYEQALQILRAVGDPQAEGEILIRLGRIYSDLEDKLRALEYYEQALSISRSVGDPQAEGVMVSLLADFYRDLGEKNKALECYEQGLLLFKEVGDRQREGVTLSRLGDIYRDLGDKSKALECYEQTLPISREVGDRRGEEMTLSGLVHICEALGEKNKALEYYKQALNGSREVGDRKSEGMILGGMGNIYRDLGDKPRALECFEQAVHLFKEVGDHQREGGTLSRLGDIYRDLGNKPKALECFERALSISREIGERRGEVAELSRLGDLYYSLGDKSKALECFEQVLPIFQEMEDRKGEGGTLSRLGSIYRDLGDKLKAFEHYEQALPIFREVGDRKGEGGTLWNVGVLALSQHRHDLALAALLVAIQRFKEVSSPQQNAVEKAIDRLRQEIGQQQFADLQIRVEPRAQQIIEQELHAKQT